MSVGFISIMDLVLSNKINLADTLHFICEDFGKGQLRETATSFANSDVVGALRMGTTNLYQLMVETCTQPLKAVIGWSETVAESIMEQAKEFGGNVNKYLEKLASISLDMSKPSEARALASATIDQWELRSTYADSVADVDMFNQYADQTLGNQIRLLYEIYPEIFEKAAKMAEEKIGK